MSQDTWEDVQAEVDDARDTLNGISEDLDNAESCDTATDFDANIREAIRGAKQLVKELTELQERIPGRKTPRLIK